jgi:chemotaxis protein CheX
MRPDLTLYPVLDIQAAEPLRTQLLAARGEDLTLDASGVERLGALCLQLVISAQKTWAKDGRTMVIDQPSDAFATQWKMFGAGEMTPQSGEPA